jgi:ferritin-like protein
VTAPTPVPPDVAGAQTAAAVEHVLIAAYGRLGGLAYVQDLGLGEFLARTAQQHADHLEAFNGAAVRLGGKAQDAPDQPFLTSVVEPGLAKVASGTEAVMFAARLEIIAAATYTAQVASVTDSALRATLASVAGVECQHQGVLFVAVSLLAAGSATVGGFPLAARRLPPTLQGPPVAFLRTDQARPVAEGAAP